MEFSKVILSRRSIRNFKSDNVPDDNIRELIKAAIYAPSSGNRQPWHFYVVKDVSVRNKIYEKSCHQELISSAPVLIAVCIDLNKDTKVYGERGEKLYNIQDTAAAIQNILLSATDMGLGTCWCGDFDEGNLKEILNLDDKRIPVAIVAVGYANIEPNAPKRKSVDEVVTFIGEFDKDETEESCEEVRIAHCNMGGTVFNDVNLGGAVFDNVNLGGAVFNDINLAGAVFNDINLAGAVFNDINFYGVSIENANIEGMKINGISISDILKEGFYESRK